jgi:hypothetical protein
VQCVVEVDRACGRAEGVCQFLGDAAPATHVCACEGRPMPEMFVDFILKFKN